VFSKRTKHEATTSDVPVSTENAPLNPTVATTGNDAPLLDVRDLHVEFRTRDGVAKVLNGVSYDVQAGETLAVLGESGSGKSVTVQTVMGILDIPPGVITGGEVRFHGQDMLTMTAEQRRLIRGDGIAMVFQDALSALTARWAGEGDRRPCPHQSHRPAWVCVVVRGVGSGGRRCS